VILLPSHPCLPGADGAAPYGDLDARNVATCRERVRWGIQRTQDVRLPGCGARIAVCHGCGLRTRVNGARCGACGGEERPEVMHVARDVAAESVVVPMAVRDGQGDTGPRRSAKEKAPSKPRAPQRRVKKGAAAPDDPGLPLFK
jgi:hypothetical protein